MSGTSSHVRCRQGPGAPRKPSWRRSLPYLPVTLILAAVSLMMLAPLAWLVMSAMKTNSEIFNSPWSPPAELRFGNFAKAWTVARLGTYVFNSVWITSVSVVAILALSSMAAFAFARLRFRGRNVLFAVFLIGLIIPIQGVLVPLFLLLKKAGLLYTYPGLILSYVAWGLPLAIYVMRAFFLSLPRDLEDAARIDGCGLFGIYWRILLPIAKPAIATIAVFSALGVWNELLLVQLFINEDTMQTLPRGLLAFSEKYRVDYGLTFSAITMIAVPMIALYAVFQRWFIDGLTAGAVKG
ncbi:MAG: carbohydrate ABC transporter permease [Phycisphaerae bacterium]|nr:carbohydrate ABC transporter permease [Phycisphaerae bacterium]